MTDEEFLAGFYALPDVDRSVFAPSSETTWPGLPALPKCECGAHKLGIGYRMAGHSSWCPWVAK